MSYQPNKGPRLGEHPTAISGCTSFIFCLRSTESRKLEFVVSQAKVLGATFQGMGVYPPITFSNSVFTKVKVFGILSQNLWNLAASNWFSEALKISSTLLGLQRESRMNLFDSVSLDSIILEFSRNPPSDLMILRLMDEQLKASMILFSIFSKVKPKSSASFLKSANSSFCICFLSQTSLLSLRKNSQARALSIRQFSIWLKYIESIISLYLGQILPQQYFSISLFLLAQIDSIKAFSTSKRLKKNQR